MKKLTLILIPILFSNILFAQTNEREMIEIGIRYMSSFSTLSENYKLKLNKREVVYISPITEIPSGKQKVKNRKFSQKKWNKLTTLIDALNLNSLKSSTGQGFDGDWYLLNIVYSDQTIKELKIWSGYASNELVELHKLLKNRK